MSQQYPQQPGYGPPQQPGWGAPNPQGQQQGWGAPPPPPKKTSAGKIIAIIAGVFVALIVIGAIASSGSSSNDDKGSAASTPSKGEVVQQEDSPASEEKAADEEAVSETPVKVTAKKTVFVPSILADGSNYTSVKVKITNNSDDTISVNVLYFGITDSEGTKHSAELAVDENQIDTVKLAPGENVSGAITGNGKFTPEYVTYTDSLFGDPVRASVS